MRYLSGNRRTESRGAPDVLGLFTEIVCFAIYASRGTDIQRIIRHTQGPAGKRPRAPIPDFLIVEAGVTGLLECKGTDGFDFADFAAAIRSRRSFVCREVADANARALEQLGYDASLNRVTYDHFLHTPQSVIQFPSTFGRGFAAAWIDGRWGRQSVRAIVVPPPACKTLSYSCENCLAFHSDRINAVILDAYNAPGLAAAIRERPESKGLFFKAYGRVVRSVWLGSGALFAVAVRSFYATLAEVVYEERREAHEGVFLFFQDYWTRVASERGMAQALGGAPVDAETGGLGNGSLASDLLSTHWESTWSNVYSRYRQDLAAVSERFNTVELQFLEEHVHLASVLDDESIELKALWYGPLQVDLREGALLARVLMEILRFVHPGVPAFLPRANELGIEVDERFTGLGWSFDLGPEAGTYSVYNGATGSAGVYEIAPVRITATRGGASWVRIRRSRSEQVV